MEDNEYLEMLYENYNENFEGTLEYKKASEELEKKFSEMKEKYTEEQLKDIEEFEQCLLKVLEMENKFSFKAGFKSAISLKKEVN